MNVYYKVTPIDRVRYHTAAFMGSVECIRQRRSYCYCRTVWLILWIYGALLTVAFLRSVGALFGMVVILALQLRQLVPFETYLQRCFLERYGSDPVREVALVMDDYGVTERESEVVCYAPWAKIQNARIYRDLLILQIESGRHIVIPRHSLEPGEMTLEAILEEVSTRIGAPRTQSGVVFR